MADKRKGWVLLYRSLRDSWIWDYKPFDPARAWIDLILDANHDDGKVFTGARLVTVKRGQSWTSIRSLATRWGWSKDRVSKFLKTLESDSMIHISRTPYGTLLTIVNYGFFQDRQDTNKDTKRTLTRTQSGRKQGRNKEGVKEGIKKEKEASLSSREKVVTEDEGDPTWFDRQVMEDDTAEH